MYAASRKNAPCAMLTVRISPKMRVKPEATTNSRPANVSPSSSVTANCPGSSIAAPADVSAVHDRSARNRTHTTANVMTTPTRINGSLRTRRSCVGVSRKAPSLSRGTSSVTTSDVDDTEPPPPKITVVIVVGATKGPRERRLMVRRRGSERTTRRAGCGSRERRRRAVASVRVRTCSFIRMLLTWFLTVNTLRLSALAISAFVLPSAMQPREFPLARRQRRATRRRRRDRGAIV